MVVVVVILEEDSEDAGGRLDAEVLDVRVRTQCFNCSLELIRIGGACGKPRRFCGFERGSNDNDDNDSLSCACSVSCFK